MDCPNRNFKKPRFTSRRGYFLFLSGWFAVGIPVANAANATDPDLQVIAQAAQELASGHPDQAWQIFQNLDASHPGAHWGRKLRDQWAQAADRSGHEQQADRIWAGLLCESNHDDLAFSITMELALAEKRRGKLRSASIALRSLYGGLLAKQSPRERQQYGALKADLNKALASDATSSCSSAVDPIVERISRLKTAPYELKKLKRLGESQTIQRLRVVGRFPNRKMGLFCGPMPVRRSADGRFSLELEISHNLAAVSLFAAAPCRPVQRHNEEYFQLDWGRFKVAKVEADLLPVEVVRKIASTASPLHLKESYVGISGQWQPGSLYSVGPTVGWSPRYFFSPHWDLHALLGIFMGEKFGGKIFPGLDYRLLLSYSITQRLHLEAGGGADTWIGVDGTHPLGTARLGWYLSSNRASPGVLSEFAANYSVRFDGFPTSEMALGITFSFP